MQIFETSGWEDYELIDSGNGRRLERFGKYILSRPDPQAIWLPKLDIKSWEKAHAIFADKWILNTDISEKWLLKYKDLSFWAKLTPFKHTGIFPEQILNWEFISNSLSQSQFSNLKVLNLFGYTGIASLIAANAGAKVTHVDASKPAITWLKENEEASGLTGKIRVISDDVLKFTDREIKRGNKYEGIIMDPPIYGHSPEGNVWSFNNNFPNLMNNVSKILSDDSLFVIVNAYALSSSALMLENVMNDYLGNLGGKIEIGELALKEKVAGRLLSTGIFARWSKI
ncbi:MAG: class I SAM-dependent methyltransferase [Patescibacteria group bacterium]